MRVIRGDVDWPNMKMRYRLAGPGHAVVQGTESIADLKCHMHAPSYSDSDPQVTLCGGALAAWRLVVIDGENSVSRASASP